MRGRVMRARTQVEQARPMSDVELLGSKLKDAREYVGMEPEQVAACIGNPVSSIFDIESGKRAVSGTELKKLAKLYLRPLEYFSIDERAESIELDHLIADASKLSDRDRQALQRFTEFLQGQSRVDSND